MRDLPLIVLQGADGSSIGRGTSEAAAAPDLFPPPGRQTIRNGFRAQRHATPIARFTGVERGRNRDRPELGKALHLARGPGTPWSPASSTGCRRNAAFLLTLRDSGVRFRRGRPSEASNLTVGIMALVAQQEEARVRRRRAARGRWPWPGAVVCGSATRTVRRPSGGLARAARCSGPAGHLGERSLADMRSGLGNPCCLLRLQQDEAGDRSTGKSNVYRKLAAKIAALRRIVQSGPGLCACDRPACDGAGLPFDPEEPHCTWGALPRTLGARV